MYYREQQEIRRMISEVRNGFDVTEDPWKLVEKLLNDNERLENKLKRAFDIGFEDYP